MKQIQHYDCMSRSWIDRLNEHRNGIKIELCRSDIDVRDKRLSACPSLHVTCDRHLAPSARFLPFIVMALLPRFNCNIIHHANKGDVSLQRMHYVPAGHGVNVL